MSTREVLGVGWDVGGWIGRKQAVAAVRYSAAKVEWLGHPRTFSIVTLDQLGGRPLDLIRLAWTDAPLDTLEQYRVVLAIDAPLGFPRAFQRLVTGDLSHEVISGPEISNPFAYRETERMVHQTFGKKPLSAPFDKLGNNATVAISHARRWADEWQFRMVPFEPDNGHDPVAIEVYPALLKSPSEGICWPRLARLLPPRVVPGTDPYDAAICAILGLAYGLGGMQTDLPPLVGPAETLHRETLTAEGWIYYVPPVWLESSSQHLG